MCDHRKLCAAIVSRVQTLYVVCDIRGRETESKQHPKKSGNNMMNNATPLRRSVYNRQIAGVCGGLGDYFSIDPTAVRVGYVLLSIFSAAFPGIIVYCLLWMLIPEREYY